MIPSSMQSRGPLPVDDSYDATLNGDINPEPILLEDTEILVGDFLSPARLQEIAGRDDLENVTTIEMIVNTTETTMGSFGSYLPKLKYLKLSNSVISSVRDVGTSLSHLNVLWMSCCGLRDVDGIASMVSLSELYLAYNDIEDISPLSFMENLQVLDLEGNRISDKDQFDYLSMLMKLRTFSISGNPVCQMLNKEALHNLESNSFQCSTDTMSYREVIIKKLPQLKYIDDQKCANYTSAQSNSSSDRPSTASLAVSSHSQEDVDLINNAIKEGLITEEETAMCLPGETRFGSPRLVALNSRPMSAGLRRPMTAMGRPTTAGPLNRSLRSPLSRPQTAISGGRASSAGALRAEMILQKASNAQRPSSTGPGDVSLHDESSTLTFGDVICGNPIKALRARKSSPMPVLNMLKRNESPPRRQLPQRPSTAAPLQKKAPEVVSEIAQHKDDLLKDRDDLYLELKEWRTKHEERISALKSDTQVLTLDNNTSSDEILLGSDATDSDADESLDLDSIPGLKDDINNLPELITHITKVKPEAPLDFEVQSSSRDSQFRARSPPPKNLSPSSVTSSQSPRSSPLSPRSPLYFSSTRLDSATVPVLRGLPKPRTPTSPSQRDGTMKHVPAPPKAGAPRPRTAADFRLRRSLVGSSNDTFVPLASPMALPLALSPTKRKPKGHVNT